MALFQQLATFHIVRMVSSDCRQINVAATHTLWICGNYQVLLSLTIHYMSHNNNIIFMQIKLK